jgi:hypothetical protein
VDSIATRRRFVRRSYSRKISIPLEPFNGHHHFVGPANLLVVFLLVSTYKLARGKSRKIFPGAGIED